MPIKTFLVDLKKERERKNYSLLSDFLVHTIRETLARNEQVLLFLNKRGYASSLVCMKCGANEQCPHCDLTLTTHQAGEKRSLECHFCGFIQNFHSQCSQCNHDEMKLVGTGTQRIEEDLKQLFPEHTVARFDTDNLRQKNAHSEMYTAILEKKVDIIIGTQVLAKGLDIPNITLVGVLNSDIGLHIPDFRANERMFQLITQVMGRGGRRGQDSNVIIQSFNPEHPTLQFAIDNDYMGFFRAEMAERKQFRYPPFCEIIKLIFVKKEEKKLLQEVESAWESLSKQTKDDADVELRKAPAFIYRQHNKYHYHIFIKTTSASAFLQKTDIPKGVRIDVDPVQMV